MMAASMTGVVSMRDSIFYPYPLDPSDFSRHFDRANFWEHPTYVGLPAE